MNPESLYFCSSQYLCFWFQFTFLDYVPLIGMIIILIFGRVNVYNKMAMVFSLPLFPEFDYYLSQDIHAFMLLIIYYFHSVWRTHSPMKQIFRWWVLTDFVWLIHYLFYTYEGKLYQIMYLWMVVLFIWDLNLPFHFLLVFKIYVRKSVHSLYMNPFYGLWHWAGQWLFKYNNKNHRGKLDE